MKEDRAILELFKRATFQETDGKGKALVYHELVFFRFLQTLENIYPVSMGLIQKGTSKSHLDELIRKFISTGAKSRLIRHMAEEFQFFLKKEADFKWMDDLLWYEWSEADLFFSGASSGQTGLGCKFQLQAHGNLGFTLSQAARRKVIAHEVYHEPLKEIEPTGIVLYLDFQQKEVKYKTLSLFVMSALDYMEEGRPVNQAFDQTAEDYKIESSEKNEAAGFFSKVINDLLEEKIIELNTETGKPVSANDRNY